MATTSVPRKITAKPRLVDFLNEKDDHECAFLAAMGFSTYYIAERTGLSPCQITYRIKKAGLTSDSGASRRDFRNGVSPFAKTLLGIAREQVDQDLVRFLKKNS